MKLFTKDTRPFYITVNGLKGVELTGALLAVFLDNDGLAPITNVVSMANDLDDADWENGKFAFSFPREETIKLDKWHGKAVTMEFSFEDTNGKKSWQVLMNISKGNT